MMDTVALLKQLSQTTGISGHEAPIRSVILAEWGRYVAETRVDKLGNAIALKPGNAGTHPSTTRRAHSERNVVESKNVPATALRMLCENYLSEVNSTSEVFISSHCDTETSSRPNPSLPVGVTMAY